MPAALVTSLNPFWKSCCGVLTGAAPEFAFEPAEAAGDWEPPPEEPPPDMPPPPEPEPPPLAPRLGAELLSELPPDAGTVGVFGGAPPALTDGLLPGIAGDGAGEGVCGTGEVETGELVGFVAGNAGSVTLGTSGSVGAGDVASGSLEGAVAAGAVG